MEIPTKQTHEEDWQNKRILLFGIAVWFLHLNIVYGLSSLACKWSWLDFHIAGIPGLQIVETILTLAALGLMAYLVYLPWRNWRKYQEKDPPENPEMMHDTEKDRHAMAAFILMGMNAFFFLFILASFVPIFALKACIQS